MTPEHHIIDDGLIDQVPDLDEAGHRRDQSEHSHGWVPLRSCDPSAKMSTLVRRICGRGKKGN